MRSHYRAWILCGALGICLTSGGLASAQPTTNPSQRATELYKQGNALYDKSKWAEAETMYRAAFELRQTFDIAGNLGDVEMVQGKPRDAAEHLSFAIREFPADGKPAQREALRKRLREAANMVGTVHIKVNVLGAEILVDGKQIGKSPLDYEIYVDRGDRVIEAKLDGYEPAQEKLTATGGSTHELDLKLKMKAGPKPPPVDTKKKVEPTDAEGGGERRSTALIMGGAMVSVAAVVTGIGLTAAANSKASDAITQLDTLKATGKLCPHPDISAGCDELLTTLEDKDSYSNTAAAAFVIGGIAGVATAVYAFWPATKSGGTVSVRPVPVVTAKETGLWLTGTF